ncbi:MerR family transcriptional regulator [Marivita sp. GX14005]|uniref:MerR family transcriptional regulator n=1 Tax=Marivita sp. GX14005 TaxID=2942276 RepID=UPI002019BEBB|nr:MerR family transcriptional regulator [Marivita sp. GX14005]MCL3882832.1 MerR family transcriptional regulator [Marivita sp. GX14005]
MNKSADAFRTISEVADWLETPAHVLRFWESKFTQVKPVKRAGGRRYYRPADMRLLGGIKKLLHEDGMTIKGVQKILREQGIRHVAGLCPLNVAEDEETGEEIDLIDAPAADPVDTVVPFAKRAPESQPQLPIEPEPAAAPEMAEAACEDQPEPERQPAERPEPVAEQLTPEPEIAEPMPEVERTAAEAEDTEPAEAAPDTGAIATDAPVEVAETPPPPADEPDAAPINGTPAPSPAKQPDQSEPRPGALSHLSKLVHLSPDTARRIAPLAEQLRQRIR